MSDITLALGIDASEAAAGAEAFNAALARIKSQISELTGLRASSQAAINTEIASSKSVADAFEAEAQKRMRLSDMAKTMSIDRSAEHIAMSETVAMSGRLAGAYDAVTAAGVRYKQYSSELATALSAASSASNDHAAASEKVAQAAIRSGASLGSMGLSASMAARETRALIDEALAGRWAQFDSTLALVGMRFFNVSAGAIATAAGFAALAAPMVLVVGHAVAMDAEIRQLNASLAATGNTAQLTGQQILTMAQSISPSTGFSRSDIASATKVIGSDNILAPDLGAAQIEQLTDAAVKFAEATGSEVVPAAQMLTQALDGGVTSLGKFNEKFPIFTQAELENIQVMIEHGQRAEALAIAAQKIDQYFSNAAKAGTSQLGAAMHELGASWSALMDSMSKSAVVTVPLNAIGLVIQGWVGIFDAAVKGINLFILSTEVLAEKAKNLATGGTNTSAATALRLLYGNTSGQNPSVDGYTDMMPQVTAAGLAPKAAQSDGGDPRAAERIANQNAVDDASLLALAYRKTGVEQELAIAHARDYAGNLQEVGALEKANAKFLADSMEINERHAAAIRNSNLAVEQQIEDSDMLQKAWNGTTQEGVLAEATVKALAVARANDVNATASQGQINQQLINDYNRLSQSAGEYLRSLERQDQASKALAEAAGDPEATAQAQINAKVTQRFADELATAQVIKDRIGDEEALLQVQQQMNDDLSHQLDMHKNGVTVSLKEELATQSNQLELAQLALSFGIKNTEEARVALAVEQEKQKLRRMGVEDLSSENAQQAINNVAEMARIAAQSDAQQKAYQDQVRQAGQTCEEFPAAAVEAFNDMLEEIFK